MAMSLTRLQPSHNPVKKLKSILLPDKPCEIFAILARIFILCCLVSSISLIFYTTFFPQTHSLHFPAPKRTAPEPKPEHEFGPTNISHILFGIGGSAATWNDRSRYSSLWWDAKKTRGFVWLDKIPGDKNNSFRISAPPYRLSSREWTRFKFSSSRSAVRIARIISDSFKLNLPDVRWFVMGDDDTVYFIDNLVSVLAKYDHHQMWYIGGNSESVEQDVMHTYGMAFGGGGFAISYPLAEKLVKILDGCLDRYYYFYGSDERIWACISEIGVPLTREQGFHQSKKLLDFQNLGKDDLLEVEKSYTLVKCYMLEYKFELFFIASSYIRGSAYGLLAAHPVAPLLDPPRILQQTFCHDKNRKWSISIAWGFTVQLYPLLLPAKDLQTPLLTFKTWRSRSTGPFTFNTQPMKSNPCELPVVFMLEQPEEVGQSGSLTRYKRLEPWPGKKCNRIDYAEAMSLQRIVVSALKLDPEFWTKNHERRRQCCDLRA
ncbi:hypothetical protein GH714_011302 [Hevea brasiliensis]|uniref:Uncharacterized protein n=1 Tax=Hevea brasiliensis TaxID=3981 RepID=A0A6A6MZH5_HEVBR|nr:hypothetical protein GH714_011302 [Hevea brasiliensis]